MPQFCCPICASINWREVVVRRADGAPYRTAFFECCGCSAMFSNPELFSAARGQSEETWADQALRKLKETPQ